MSFGQCIRGHQEMERWGCADGTAVRERAPVGVAAKEEAVLPHRLRRKSPRHGTQMAPPISKKYDFGTLLQTIPKPRTGCSCSFLLHLHTLLTQMRPGLRCIRPGTGQ